MPEPRCPRDPSHTITVVNKDVPEPHRAALECAECHEHIKWLSRADAKAHEDCTNQPQSTICPFPRPDMVGVLCKRGACQLWWLCDNEGILAKYLGLSAPLIPPYES